MFVLRVSYLSQSFSKLNKIYKLSRKNYSIVVSINLTPSYSFVSYLAGAYFNWCQYFDTILFLLFAAILCMQQFPTFIYVCICTDTAYDMITYDMIDIAHDI